MATIFKKKKKYFTYPHHVLVFDLLLIINRKLGSLLHADIEIFLPEHPSQILSSTTTWNTGKKKKKASKMLK